MITRSGKEIKAGDKIVTWKPGTHELQTFVVLESGGTLKTLPFKEELLGDVQATDSVHADEVFAVFPKEAAVVSEGK